jgi:hypothetical protein
MKTVVFQFLLILLCLTCARDASGEISAPLDLVALKRKAEKRDVESALILYNFYKINYRSPSLRMRWLQIAATHGNPTAEYNLASEYFRVYGRYTAARFWCEKAIRAGNPFAPQLLLEIEAVQKTGLTTTGHWHVLK